MNQKHTAKHPMSLAARLALCVGIGTALTVSSGAAVGIAVAAFTLP